MSFGYQILGFGAGSVKPVDASGGTETTYGIYTVHKFTTTGTLTVNTGGGVDILVVAGGGGGGTDYAGGGGGAGGLRWFTAQDVVAQDYTVTVGAGGAIETNGDDSSFAGSGFTTITASGGGFGGEHVASPGIAGTGGSGGGAGANDSTSRSGGAGNEGSYTPVEGTAGGSSAHSGADFDHQAGGGGGAGGVGGDGNSSTKKGGDGGVGEDNFLNQSSTALTQSDTTDLLFGAVAGTDASNDATDGNSSGALYIAGGGGGGSGWSRDASGGDGYRSAAGKGGGGLAVGSPSEGVSVAGLVNTGGGGGGAARWCESSACKGAAGGKGVVLIRYKT